MHARESMATLDHKNRFEMSYGQFLWDVNFIRFQWVKLRFFMLEHVVDVNEKFEQKFR